MSVRTVLLLLLGASLAAAAEREFTGRVVDANTGEPVARAHVTVHFFQAQGGQPPPEVTLLSDTDGTFKITNLPDGGLQVSCEKAGYLPWNQGMAPMPPGISPDGKAASSTVVKLIAQAAIEGTAVDDKDIPIQNTLVQLLRQQVMNGRRQFQMAGNGITDETGYFRVFGLPAGRYYISITPTLNGARRTKALAYPQFYYPNATEIAAAQPLDLKAGDEAQIALRMPPPVPAFEVRGVVAAATSNVNVMLVRQVSSPVLQQPDMNSNWDPKTNSFHFSHVTPGIYVASAAVQDGRNSLRATATIVVGSADVTGIRLEPVDIGLDGTVRTDGDTGQQRVSGFVAVHSERTGNAGQVDAEGKFHIPNLEPDTYKIVPQLYGPQVCVRSVVQGGRDARDGLTIAPGAAPEPIEIVVTSHCGSVDVTVTPSDSGLPPNLMAVLLRKSGDEFVLEKQSNVLANMGETASHGLIQGVAPGDYMVFVWPQDAQIEYANAEYIRQVASYGQAVTVTEDGKVSVTIDKILTTAAKN